MHKHSSRGFSHIALLLVFAVVVGTAIFAYGRVKNSVGTDTTASPSAGCLITNGVEVCLRANNADIAYHGVARLTATVKNTSQKPFTYYETSISCGGRKLYVNEKEIVLSMVCPDVVDEPVDLPPGETITYDHDVLVLGDELKPGNNKVSIAWRGISSGELTLTGHEQTSEEADEAKRCLEGKAAWYCTKLTVSFKKQYYHNGSTCEELSQYFDHLGLSPSKCSSSRFGELEFSVPVGQTQDWIGRLKTIEEVDEVLQQAAAGRRVYAMRVDPAAE